MANAPAFQAGYVGSIPITRFECKRKKSGATIFYANYIKRCGFFLQAGVVKNDIQYVFSSERQKISKRVKNIAAKINFKFPLQEDFPFRQQSGYITKPNVIALHESNSPSASISSESQRANTHGVLLASEVPPKAPKLILSPFGSDSSPTKLSGSPASIQGLVISS